MNPEFWKPRPYQLAAMTGPIVIVAQGRGRLGRSFYSEGQAFRDALSRPVSIPVTLNWTRYGRLKMRQLMGERLSRRNRKHIWNVEHRTKKKQFHEENNKAFL